MSCVSSGAREGATNRFVSSHVQQLLHGVFNLRNQTVNTAEGRREHNIHEPEHIIPHDMTFHKPFALINQILHRDLHQNYV